MRVVADDGVTMKLRSLGIVAVLATLVAVLSCGGADGTAPPTLAEPGAIARVSDSTLLAGLNVSGPIAEGLVPPALGALDASVALSAEVSYVSLVPGTISNGTTATIINLRNQHHETVQIGDGGFDPFPIPASLGDSLLITVSRAGQPDAVAYTAVAARLAPRIVRTRPPRGQTDAPLNTIITVVFSEPLDPSSVNPTSVALTTAGTPVAGAVRVVPELGYAVEFTPSALLTPGTTYSLTVNGVTNLAGTPLAAPASVTFTTVSALGAGSVLSVTVSPDPATTKVGQQLQLTATVTDATGRVVEIPQLHALFWESSVPDVASVISVMQGMSTTVTGIGTGTAVITARVINGAQIGTGSARVTVNSATTPTGAIASTLCSQFDGPCGVYALDPDGSNGRFLTSNPWDLDPVWSPDGTSIAFRSQRACGGGRFCLTDLYVLKVDGSGVRSLTTGLGLEVGGMSWSPDGSRIVFAAGALAADLRFDEALYVMNADGSGLRMLLSGPPGASASWPDWSPDGGRIAYTAVRGDTSAINVVNADGSNEVRISTPPAPNRDVRPRWSPDGKHIAFTRWWFSGSGNTPGALSQTLVMNADGSDVRQVIDDSLWPWYPAWSPDGRSLVVLSWFYDGLFVVNADGNGGRAIPTLCCGFEMSSAPSWRRVPATVPASAESSAQR